MTVSNKKIIILGAGMTGLAAGFSSGCPVYEASEAPGGICSSYYIRPGNAQRLSRLPADNQAYRFEIGGGHWIFGGDQSIQQFMRRFVSLKKYARRSSVFFQRQQLFVPYPLQNHLRFLDRDTVSQAIREMARPQGTSRLMKEWLENSFGPTLCDLFFHPFHHLYTAGLYDRIAPQDAYKSPVDLACVIQGALDKAPPVGYNTSFVYPRQGLDELARNIAIQCDVSYNRKIVKIDSLAKRVFFATGEKISYDKIISTLPLNTIVKLVGLSRKFETDPHSSVMVLNIGAFKGDRCPRDHWLYTPDALSGFHRVGFYSNVDPSFLPSGSNKTGDRVSLYVERAYTGGVGPSKKQIKKYSDAVIAELQEWGFIKEVEVIDPTWIEVAYTWSWPDSNWKLWALNALEKKGILQVGRYGRWAFHGIADSIRDGLYVGAAMKPLKD